jgi:hypothetical protein
MGPQGPAGADGADGVDGAAGATGDVGPAGPTGPTGPAGADGADGVDGAAGPTGPTGPAGADGADGADGAMGPAGPTGPTGPAGADGTDGVDGAAGPTGPTGPAGADGTDGVDGAAGPTGPTGPAGADGTDGADGAMGPAGPTGPAGPASVTGIYVIKSVPPAGQELDLALVPLGFHAWASEPVEIQGLVQGTRLVVSASTSAFIDPIENATQLGWPSGYTSQDQFVPFTICHAPAIGAILEPMNGPDADTYFTIKDNLNSAISVHGTMEVPANGTYYVGLCVNQKDGVANRIEFDFASGWVMVLPPQP